MQSKKRLESLPEKRNQKERVLNSAENKILQMYSIRKGSFKRYGDQLGGYYFTKLPRKTIFYERG